MEDLILKARESYIKKEEFIQIITNLKFDTIETAKIHFITAYEYIPEKENQRSYVKTYGFDFDIY